MIHFNNDERDEMSKDEHTLYLLGQIKSTLNHITFTSYNDMAAAQHAISLANGYFGREIEAIFKKTEPVNPKSEERSQVSISNHGVVNIWTS